MQCQTTLETFIETQLNDEGFDPSGCTNPKRLSKRWPLASTPKYVRGYILLSFRTGYSLGYAKYSRGRPGLVYWIDWCLQLTRLTCAYRIYMEDTWTGWTTL